MRSECEVDLHHGGKVNVSKRTTVTGLTSLAEKSLLTDERFEMDSIWRIRLIPYSCGEEMDIGRTKRCRDDIGLMGDWDTKAVKVPFWRCSPGSDQPS